MCMKIEKEEYRVIRAGIVPFFYQYNTLVMYFMVPSNAKFGGPDPQIAKGVLDDITEEEERAALREGHEELGLKQSNIEEIFHAHTQKKETKKGWNKFSIFAAKIIDPCDFDVPGFETEECIWINEHEVSDFVRKDQKILVYNTIRKIKNINK